jgi:hypothetical protein
MKAMKGLGLCGMVAAVALLGAGAAHAGAEITHFKTNGAMASHNSSDGVTAYDLGVNVNTTSSGTTTFLSFETQTCNADFSVCSGIFGFGTIPNADFKASTGTASLNTNLATNSGFTLFNYVNDFVNNVFTQTPAAVVGTVVINWKKTPRQSSSFSGTSTNVSGPFSNTFKGTQSADSATTIGTLLGIQLPTNSSSFIGTTTSSQKIISRN